MTPFESGAGESYENSQIQRAVPATQDDLEAMTFEGEVDPTRFGKYEEWSKYKDGGHSIIYFAYDSKTENVVAIKEHLHYMPERADESQAIRAAEDRYKREVDVLSKLNHPGIVRPRGFFFREKHGIPTPYLVMEPLEQDSIEDRLERGEVFDEGEAKKTLVSVGSIMDFLHTVSGRPILYRDMKPGNIKIMPEDASWPHKVVDFSESRIGNITSSGSVLGTIGYNAPEVFGDGIADPSADRYSMARIVAHMLIGDNKQFMQNYFGSPSLRDLKQDGDLKASDEFLRVIEKATARNPEDRHKSFLEMMHDLGYNSERVPQTRAELEAILGGRGLPVPIQEPESRAVAEGEEGNLPSEWIIERQDTGNLFAVRQGGIYSGLAILIDENGKDVYDTAKNLRESSKNILMGLPSKRKYLSDEDLEEIDREVDRATYAYLQHAAQENHLLRGLAYEMSRLENIAKNGWKDKETRAELCKILGVDEDNFGYNNFETTVGILIGTLASVWGSNILPGSTPELLLPWILGHMALGTITGSNIQRYGAKRKLLKKARKLDGWIHQAKVSSGLEEKVEDVSLTKEEEKEVSPNREVTLLTYIGVGMSFGALSGFNLDYLPLAVSVGVGSGIAEYFGFKKYLTNRALKQKRESLGLPAKPRKPEMREIETIEIPRERYGNMESILKEGHNLRKGFWRRFVGDGIKIKYKVRIEDAGREFAMSPRDYPERAYRELIEITINATKEAEEKAQPVIEALKSLGPGGFRADGWV